MSDSLIRDLDDATAIRVLQTFASARARQADVVTRWTPDVRDALLQAVDAAPIAPAGVSEGELAREMLLALSSDPELREPLRALIHHPPPQRFLEPGTMALGAAALIALQTHVEFKKNEDGTWSLKIVKEPLSTELIKELIKKLVAYFGA